MSSFLKFSFVGFIAFGVDAISTLCLHHYMTILPTLILSYLFSATTAWYGNHIWSFYKRGRTLSLKEWATYLTSNLSGFFVNRGVTIIFYTTSLFQGHTTIPLAFGALSGLVVNYTINKYYVFKSNPS